MLFVALTGRVPFEGGAAAILARQLRAMSGDPAPRARALAPDVPEALNELCAAAMALDVAERLESAKALVAGLDAYRTRGEATALVAAPPAKPSLKTVKSTRTPAARHPRGPLAPDQAPRSSRAVALAVGLALLGGALGLGGAVVLGGSSSGREPEPRVALAPSTEAPSDEATPSEPTPSEVAPPEAVPSAPASSTPITTATLSSAAVTSPAPSLPAASVPVAPAREGVEEGPSPEPTTGPAPLEQPWDSTPAPPPTPASPAAPVVEARPFARPRPGKTIVLASGQEVQLFVYTLPQNAGEIEMLHVPAGDFWMGSDDPDAFERERPRHRQTLAHSYWIARTPTTWDEWMTYSKVAQRTEGVRRPSWWDSLPEPRGRHPVVAVSWDAAHEYCRWAGLRLPSEAEWEKAARGTDGRRYPWGNTFDPRRLNFADKNCLGDVKGPGGKTLDQLGGRDLTADDGFAYTAPVGTFPLGVSPYGLLDMAGNAASWTEDRATAGAHRNANGNERVYRGGSWRSTAHGCRCADRNSYPPSRNDGNIGFRVCLTDE